MRKHVHGTYLVPRNGGGRVASVQHAGAKSWLLLTGCVSLLSRHHVLNRQRSSENYVAGCDRTQTHHVSHSDVALRSALLLDGVRPGRPSDPENLSRAPRQRVPRSFKASGTTKIRDCRRYPFLSHQDFSAGATMLDNCVQIAFWCPQVCFQRPADPPLKASPFLAMTTLFRAFRQSIYVVVIESMPLLKAERMTPCLPVTIHGAMLVARS